MRLPGSGDSSHQPLDLSALRSRPSVILACAAMTGLGILRAHGELWRLLYEPGRSGAVDLEIFARLVQGWFHGEPLYGRLGTAVHPPASYLLLWPLFGWLDEGAARWWFLFLVVPTMLWVAGTVARASASRTTLQQLLILLVPLTAYASWAAVGNGQVSLFQLAVVLAAVPAAVSPGQPGRWRDPLIVGGLTFALVKPQFTLPFLWLLAWSPRGRRLVVATAASYAVATLIAMAFQHESPPALFREWLDAAQGLAVRSATDGSFANVHAWLVPLGFERWILPASAVLFLATGAWTWAARGAPIWLQLGVAGLVARLWAYHRLYDDLLILPAMVAMLQLAGSEQRSPRRSLAELLFWAGMASALGPARWQHAAWFGTAQSVIWCSLLAFLAWSGLTPPRNHCHHKTWSVASTQHL